MVFYSLSFMERGMNNLIRKEKQKNLLRFLVAIPLMFLLSTVLFSGKGFAAQAFKAGDILVTSKSETTFYTGHNGIVLENGKVLHSPAPGKTPSTLSASEWRTKYKTGVIIRPTSSSRGVLAAQKANAYYVLGSGQYLPYKVATFDVTTSTYCTKLVADSYKRAGSPFVATSKYIAGTHPVNFLVPNDIKNSNFMKLNGLKNLGQY